MEVSKKRKKTSLISNIRCNTDYALPRYKIPNIWNIEMSNIKDRINQEWVTLNAIRGMVKIASKGSISKSTYDNSLDLGGVLYPELLGPETSLLKRERESDTTKLYRKKAKLFSLQKGKEVTALEYSGPQKTDSSIRWCLS